MESDEFTRHDAIRLAELKQAQHDGAKLNKKELSELSRLQAAYNEMKERKK